MDKLITNLDTNLGPVLREQLDSNFQKIQNGVDGQVDSLNKQIETMLGDVPLQDKNEVTQARIDIRGDAHSTLKGRIDDIQSTAETSLEEERTIGEEVSQARINPSGINYKSLKERIDTQENNINRSINDKISQISAVPETFVNVSELKKTYPSGKAGLFVVADTGHKYIWANNSWTDAGVYQAVGVAEGTINTNQLSKISKENLSSKMLDIEVSPLSQGFKKYIYFDLETGNLSGSDGSEFPDNASARTSFINFDEENILIINKNKKYRYQMYEWDNDGKYLDLTFGYKNNELFSMVVDQTKKYKFVISTTDGASIDISDVNVNFALAKKSDTLGYSIDNLFKITNGFLLTAGGKQPKFSGPYGAYNMDITMPENNISFYDGYGEFVAKTPDSYKSKVITLPNNNSLIWDTHTGLIFAQPLDKANYERNVVLAVNSYGDISDGYFSKHFYESKNSVTFAEDYMPYMGGVGYTPDFLNHYDYSIDITLPKDNTFYINDKSGNNISKMTMSSQKYTLAAKQGLFFDIASATMVIDNGTNNRLGRVLLAYNNYGRITNGYFSQFFYKQSLTQNMKSYWRDYMPGKISQILEKEKSYNSGDEFIFITDTHWGDNDKQSPLLLKNIVNNTGVQNVLFGGDIPRAFGNKEVIDEDVVGFNTAIRKYKQHRNYYPIIGNHDFTIKFNRTDDTGFTYGLKESYGMFGRELENYTNISNQKMYYYRDNTAQKIRYVFVNTEESINNNVAWGVQAKISQEQADWLVNTALNVPTGYQIFVVGHVPIHPDLSSYSSNLDILRKIFEAINNKTSLSFDTGYGTVVNHDFTNTNTKVIAYLAGHCHKDSSKSDNGLLHITTGCDAHYSDDVWTRVPQTTSEQLFDVFFIDTENSKINTVRIGAGNDRSFDY